jgi:hypothetical protein
MNKTKICTKCKKELSATLNFFYKHSGCKYGVMNSCKTCYSGHYKERNKIPEVKARHKITGALYEKNNKEKRKLSRKKYFNDPILGEERKKKSLELHRKYDNLESRKNKQSEAYRIRKLKKQLQEIENGIEIETPLIDPKTGETLKICNVCKKQIPHTLEYFHKNGNGLKAICKNCDSIKKKNNEQYQIKKKISTRIRDALKRKDVNKTCSSLQLLGCTIEQFTTYFKSLFTPDMTWEAFMNGEIHIDHLKPCALYDLTQESEQQKCFHYKNLQPLWAKDNLSKGAKYST